MLEELTTCHDSRQLQREVNACLWLLSHVPLSAMAKSLPAIQAVVKVWALCMCCISADFAHSSPFWVADGFYSFRLGMVSLSFHQQFRTRCY